MPLKRTPPPSTHFDAETSASNRENRYGSEILCAGKESGDELVNQGGSVRLTFGEPEIDLQSFTSNISERKKRKLDEIVGGNADIALLIREMFTLFSKEQEIRFLELKSSVDLMSKKHDEFLTKIVSLEKERKADRILIKDLEEKLEALERKSRGTGIEIRNIPKQNNETKEILCDEIMRLGKTLNVEIDSSKIKDIYRLKSKDSSNPVIVDLTTVILKDKVLKATKIFNKSKPKGEKLNTTHLNSKYQHKPLYLSEALTQKTQRLFYLARQFQKTHGYNFCWTTNGIVYLKMNEGTAHVRINTDADIEKLRIEK